MSQIAGMANPGTEYAIPNVDPATKIAYGYLNANDLEGSVTDELLYGAQVKNLSYRDALAEWEADCEALEVQHQDAGTECPTHEDFDFQCDEPILEGVYEGVTYRTSWLGGACHFFILKSPLIATTADRASPCVPNCGILHPPYERRGDVMCYDIPNDWWYMNPGDSLRDWCNGAEEDFT